MPNKSLGQHWLKDRLILEAIADSIPISTEDTVLEIGPGLGTLTSVLLRRARRVIAVEYDGELARKLPGQFPGKDLEVVHADFLTYNLTTLPQNYKVLANVPYYITQKIVEQFIMTNNQPEAMALLVQREVAEKLAAQPGDLTAIAVKLQLDFVVELGEFVPRDYFTPPPKVDSQIVICIKRHVDENAHFENKQLLRVIDAGFSAPRKKLVSALSGGLAMPKVDVRDMLEGLGSLADCRAADVVISDWLKIAQAYDSL